jgi:hypothetical protein
VLPVFSRGGEVLDQDVLLEVGAGLVGRRWVGEGLFDSPGEALAAGGVRSVGFVVEIDTAVEAVGSDEATLHGVVLAGAVGDDAGPKCSGAWRRV